MIDNNKSLLNVHEDSVEIGMVIDFLLENIDNSDEKLSNDCCLGSAVETGIDFLSI